MSFISTICRVCRKCDDDSVGSFVSLFLKYQTEEAVMTIASMLEFVGNISILENDTNMPQEICFDCLEQLKHSYRFRKLVIESDDLLKKQINITIHNAGEESIAPSQQTHLESSSYKGNSVYLHNYDPGFYQLALDRYYYMELVFTARRCCGCRQAFASSDELHVHAFSAHRNNQSNITAHQCPVCFSSFPYADALHYHCQAIQSNVFCCRECYLIFEKKHTLFTHLRNVHSRADYELEKELYAEESPPIGHSIFDPDPEPNLVVSNVRSLAQNKADPYSSGYCELSPNLRLSDLRPSQYQFTERTDRFSIIEFMWHRCCACNHMFKDQGDLEIHCTEEHRLRYNPTPYMQNKSFVCPRCWRRFKKKSLLGLHQKFNRKKVYSCNTCMYIFFGGPAYEKHLPCSNLNVKREQLTNAEEDTYTRHPITKEEPGGSNEDDDVFVLDD